MRAPLALAVALFVPVLARAVPGPDSTAVLANASDPDSIDLATQYALARQIPDRQVCKLDLPATVDMSLDDFRNLLLQPLLDCLAEGGVTDRIEAVVVMRGVPLRVVIPTPKYGDQSVSLAAALGTWKSTLALDGTAFLGADPGMLYPPSGPYGGNWRNVYNGNISSPFAGQAFHAGWSATFQSVDWKPVLVTMLHGRSYADASKLLDSALTAEKNGGAKGAFVLMAGADGARGALDFQFGDVQGALESRGMTVLREPWNADRTGLSIAALAVGTAGMGQTIEGNTYLPGSLVDNLTSYGAVPQNFEETGESQVSIARWVAMGVAGAHGTTEEPINNAFPNRTFLVHYVDGFTLAESYAQEMPFFYWRNLVLGDPMAAPYAVRPQVKLNVGTCSQADGSRHVKVASFDPERLGIDEATLYVDGVQTATGKNGQLETDVTLPAQAIQLLAVVQKHDDGSVRGKARPKGWDEARVDGSVAVQPCDMGTGGTGGTGGSGGTGGIGTGGSSGSGSGGNGQGGSSSTTSTAPHDKGGCSSAGSASLLAVLLGAIALRRRP